MKTSGRSGALAGGAITLAGIRPLNPIHPGAPRPRPGSERLAEHWALGRARLVKPPDRSAVRGLPGDRRVLSGLPEDLGQRLGESVERLPGLGLRRLDQEGLVDDEREV